jgi:hypothetical protein
VIATRHNIAELYIAWLKPDQAHEYLQKNIQVMEDRAKREKEEGSEDSPEIGEDIAK